MLYVRTYIRACARSQGVRNVVKSEGAGAQTILGTWELRCVLSRVYTVTKKCPTPMYSWCYNLIILYGIIQLYIAQWITSRVILIPHVLRV